MTAGASSSGGRPWSFGWTALLIAATTLVLAFLSWAVLVLPAVAPEVAAAHGLSPSWIGVLISLAYAGAVATSLLAGQFVRRFGACAVSQVSLLLGGFGCALTVIPHLAVLIGAALAIGLGYGMTNPAASHLLARMPTGRHRNVIFSIKQTGVPLGGVLAGLLAPAAALAFGWQAAPLSVTAACLALAVLLAPLRRELDADREPNAPLSANPLRDIRLAWREAPLRRLSLMAFCYSMVQLCLTTYLVTLLVEEVGLVLVATGFALSLVQVAGVVGRVFWGWVADRVGDGLALLAVLGGISAACASAVALWGTSWPVGAVEGLFVVFGLVAIGWNGVYLAEVARMSPPGQVGAATGGSLSVTFAGVLVGPALFAAAYGPIGSYTVTFALPALAAVAGAWLVLSARAAARRA